MAKKLDIHYIRNLKLNPLNVDDLKKIIDISPLVRLYWGKEYVDFNFTSPVDYDLEIDKILQTFEGGKIPIGLYPVNGSYSLLGRGVSEYSIDIKVYALEEFCKISKNAQEVVAMKVPLDKPTSPGFIYKDLFHEVKVMKYTDYSWIITDLEKHGFVDTFPSENSLRTDERRFRLNSKSEMVIPDLAPYIGKTYEVDSLGTTFFPELSKGVVFLSSRYFKDNSSNEQILC